MLGVAKGAKEKQAKIVALTCNKQAKIINEADVSIVPVVGAEAITGSSRMKAGTAQKMVLNMLTTASMVKIGKTYENYMIDVKATNIKLKKRAVQIVVDLTDVSENQAQEILENNNWKVKNAVLMIKKGIDFKTSEEILNKHNGILRKALNE